MRRVRFSRTALSQIEGLLSQGLRQFGPTLVAEKRDALFEFIERTVAQFPAIKARHPTLGLVAYPVSRTPFVVLYDYDDDEVRIHFVMHRRASLDELDPSSANW